MQHQICVRKWQLDNSRKFLTCPEEDFTKLHRIEELATINTTLYCETDDGSKRNERKENVWHDSDRQECDDLRNKLKVKILQMPSRIRRVYVMLRDELPTDDKLGCK